MDYTPNLSVRPSATIAQSLKNAEPKGGLIDHILIEHDGIEVQVYGTLHGLTGGTNRDYVAAINKTITSLDIPMYCEKNMGAIYKGDMHDVQDYAAMRNRDSFVLATKCLGNPLLLATLLKTSIKEKLTKSSRFGGDGIYAFADIGGCLAFHTVEPDQRRELASFPSPEGYMKVNYKRRNGGCSFKTSFPDLDWAWLSHVEPHVNIPYRSIHMISYTLEHAKLNGVKKCALFVGEIHNSDIRYYIEAKQSGSVPEWLREDAQKIELKAKKMAGSLTERILSRVTYSTALLCGMFAGLSVYLAPVLWLLNCQ